MIDPMTAISIAKGAGSVFGAIQGIAGKKKMSEANKMGPSETDPARLAALEDAKIKTKQIASGTDTTTQEAIKSANQSTTSTQKQLAGVTGGATGATVSAMLQAQKQGGNIKNQAFAKASQGGIVMGEVANRIGKEISQRKLDIQQFRSVQRRAEGADAAKTGFGNMTAGLFGSLPSADGKIPGQAGLISPLLQRLSQQGGADTTGVGGGNGGGIGGVLGQVAPTAPTEAGDNAAMSKILNIPEVTTNPGGGPDSSFLTGKF